MTVIFGWEKMFYGLWSSCSCPVHIRINQEKYKKKGGECVDVHRKFALAQRPSISCDRATLHRPQQRRTHILFTLCVCWPVVCMWWRSQDWKKNKKDDRPTPLFISFARWLWNVIITLLLFIIHTHTHKSLFFRYFSGFRFYSTPLIFFLFKSTNFHSFEFLVKCYFFSILLENVWN
jgi:hypothetical protein